MRLVRTGPCQLAEAATPCESADWGAKPSELTGVNAGASHGRIPGVVSPHVSQKETMDSKQTLGFSLLEMAIVISIAMILSAITFLALQPALKEARVTQAYNTVVQQLRTAREQAVERREQYIVCFGTSTPTGATTPLGAPTAQSISIYEWPSGTALSSAKQISEVQLPSDIQFQVVTGIPTGATATPDGFGSGSVALDFDQNVGGGIKTQVMFMPDGSAHDSNGYLNSGVLYLARSSQLYSSRAVTVYAASGRVRGWRLVNQSGTVKWIQQ